MSMQTYIAVDQASSRVVLNTEVDDAIYAEWSTLFLRDSPQLTLVAADHPIGGTYSGGVYTPAPGPTPEQIAAKLARRSERETEKALKIDPWMIAFKNMSIADAEEYIDNNVTDLASAKVVLRRLAVISLLIVKDRLR